MFAQKSDGRLGKMLGVFRIFAQVSEVDVGMLPSTKRDDGFQIRVRLFMILRVDEKKR